MRSDGEDQHALDRDPALERALDSFMEWAKGEGLLDEIQGLPDPSLFELGAPRRIGDFDLVRKLGAGGAGVVWEARQVSVKGRRVAVKFLRQLFTARQAALRFQREIETIARLDHQAIVPIVSAGIEGGLPYYAMKYVEGLSVARLLDRLREGADVPSNFRVVGDVLKRASHRDEGAGQRIADVEAAWGFSTDREQSYASWVARVGLDLAEALQHAHEHGVVHRDVKPGNVVIDFRGRPVLLDFGLALVAGGDPLSKPERFLGSLPYSAPEQVLGTGVDTRADVYSLGCILYELLTLRRPFDAASETELARRIQEHEPPALGRHVPAELRTIVFCALAKSPARRYATPGAMAHDLREFLAGRPIRARPRAPWVRAVRVVRRYPRTALVALVGLLLLAVSHGWDHYKASSTTETARQMLTEIRLKRAQHLVLATDYVALFQQGEFQRIHPDPREVEHRRDELQAQRAALTRLHGACETQARRAFDSIGSYGPARRLLAELYSEELRQALHDATDLLDRPRLAAIEACLKEYPDRAHADLLDPTGDIEITCPHPGAWIRLETAARAFEGPAPLRVANLEEGAYTAELFAPGRITGRFPVLVRRRACYGEPGALPPRMLRVELLAEGEQVPGYVYVPPGWTLVEDEPPRWEQVEGFQMKLNEVTYAEWIEFLEALETVAPEVLVRMREDPFAFRPRSQDGVLHVSYADEDRRWELSNSDYAASTLPVRGLKGSEMHHYKLFEEQLRSAPAGWHYDLPRTEEFIRAARGSDARPFVWGAGWDGTRCASHRPRSDMLVHPEPYPVKTHPDDVSVFGIHDLAGSLAELSSDPYGVTPDVATYFGGTYREHRPASFKTMALRGGRDEPHDERGFRLVLRRIPVGLGQVVEAPAAIRDTFDRIASAGPGDGWIEVVGSPLTVRPAWDDSVGVTIGHGRLVCRAGRGIGSLSALALHAVRDPAGDFRLLTKLAAGWERDAHRDGNGRGVSVLLVEAPLISGGISHSVTIGPAGYWTLSAGGESALPGGQTRLEVGETGLEQHWLEIRRRGDALEVRCWPADRTRPEGPQLEAPYAMRSIGFVGVQASNLIGVWIELDEFHFEPLDRAGDAPRWADR